MKSEDATDISERCFAIATEVLPSQADAQEATSNGDWNIPEANNPPHRPPRISPLPARARAGLPSVE